MSAAATAEAQPGKKGKGKLIVIALVSVLLLVAGGGAGYWFMQKRNAGQGAESQVAHAPNPAQPPTFMTLEPMVVNLADPGGDRMIQLGITVQVSDEKSAERIKVFMPSVRSAILVLVSQRTSEELLQRDGKEKLAEEIAVEVARPLGIEPPKAESANGKRHAPAPFNPVQEVLFSSFIIQ